MTKATGLKASVLLDEYIKKHDAWYEALFVKEDKYLANKYNDEVMEAGIALTKALEAQEKELEELRELAELPEGYWRDP